MKASDICYIFSLVGIAIRTQLPKLSGLGEVLETSLPVVIYPGIKKKTFISKGRYSYSLNVINEDTVN